MTAPKQAPTLADLPYFQPLAVGVRLALYGYTHPIVSAMLHRNAMKPREARPA